MGTHSITGPYDEWARVSRTPTAAPHREWLLGHTSLRETNRAPAMSRDPQLGPTRVPAQPVPPDLTGSVPTGPLPWCRGRVAAQSARSAAGISGGERRVRWGAHSQLQPMGCPECMALPVPHSPPSAPQRSQCPTAPCHAGVAPSAGAVLGMGRTGDPELAPQWVTVGRGHPGDPPGLSDGLGALLWRGCVGGYVCV